MFGWALFRIHLSMSSRSLQAFLFALRHVSGPRGYQNGVRIQLKAISRSLVTNFSRTGDQYHQGMRLGPLMGVATLAASGIGFWNYFGRENSETTPESRLVFLPRLQAAEKRSGEEGPKHKVSLREKRYKMFASVVYNEEPYMTPRDFIESLLQDEPRSQYTERIDERTLSKKLKTTPSRRYGSNHLFRDMEDKGVLTYADYLFLITALVKTTRQFEIAFKMIDEDKSDYIDLKEFSQVQEAVSRQRDHAMLFEQSLAQSSLTVHLFGYKGRDRLYSKDFYKFIEDLQTEVLEVEFNNYSLGGERSGTITDEDFARILLRHTTWDLDPVLQRLRKTPRKGVKFEDFCDFCQLLNSLEDFGIAMTMYTIAGTPVTQEEFARAAMVCIGKSLNKEVVSTVFDIFDVDGDGRLSYREFLVVMKNWKLRGSKMREHKSLGAWDSFKACVKMEMKNR